MSQKDKQRHICCTLLSEQMGTGLNGTKTDTEPKSYSTKHRQEAEVHAEKGFEASFEESAGTSLNSLEAF